MRRDVTNAELEVLKALWDTGGATIRELTDRLYPDGRTSHYATVQKLLDRLHGKGCVARSPQGRANVYSARVNRPELIAHRLRETADKLCEGSLAPLLTQLVETRDLDPDELSALKNLVDRLEPRPEKEG